jgi:hypothetical protein
MFSDPWATIDEQIDRAQSAGWEAAQTVAQAGWDYSPAGFVYNNAPSSETMLQTLDDYTYTPWEMATDAANLIPEINWKRIALFAAGAVVLGGAAVWMVRR